jgi:hypothetical protein
VTALRLFADPPVVLDRRIDLARGDVADLLDALARDSEGTDAPIDVARGAGADLVVADPPWDEYRSEAGGTGSAAPARRWPQRRTRCGW